MRTREVTTTEVSSVRVGVLSGIVQKTRVRDALFRVSRSYRCVFNAYRPISWSPKQGKMPLTAISAGGHVSIFVSCADGIMWTSVLTRPVYEKIEF